MGNNIITLPVKGVACKPSPINQLQEDMETLLYVADGVLEDNLIADTDADGAAAENWKRYREIVRGLAIADAFGLDALRIRYRKAPNMVENHVAVAITLRKEHPLTGKAKSALVMAALLADSVSTSTDDGDVQIIFRVYDIH